MTTTRPLLLFLSLALTTATLVTVSAQPDVWGATTANAATWVALPDELLPRHQGEKEAFVGTNNNVDDRKVELRVFQLFPEPLQVPLMPSQRVWPLLVGMAQRMDGILWPRVTYYLKDGWDYECRDENNTKAIDSDHCNRHCTHEGRYCAPQIQDELRPGRHGKDVVDEVLRRLCLDQEYHTPTTFATYLQQFESEDCFSKESAEDVKLCSERAMNQAGVDPASIQDCTDSPEDQPHPVLDENIERFHKPAVTYHKRDMPQIDIDHNGLMPKDYGLEIRQWSPELIFQQYCGAFPYCENAVNKGKPVACQICSGCSNVEACLWTLQCDGRPLDLGDILSSARAPPNVTPEYSCGDQDVLSDINGPDTLAPSSAVTQESYAGTYFGIGFAGFLALCAGLALVYWFRQKQEAERRKARAVAAAEIPAYSDYNHDPSEHDEDKAASSSGIAFRVRSVRGMTAPQRNRSSASSLEHGTNMAPRPHEDSQDLYSDALSPVEHDGMTDVFV